MKSIKAFSERIIAKLDKLDVLINNAGINLTFDIFNVLFYFWTN